MIRQLRALLVSLFFLSLCSVGFAQSAQIQGQVSDSSGALIPKATVRIVNQLTGTERKAATNGSGQYNVPGLDPSVYKIFVQAPGFSTAVSTPITLNVAQNAVLDFKMQVGSEAQNITVDGSGLQINTTDGSVSTIIDRTFVANIPLNGRSFQDLILLSPGVVTNSPQSPSSTGFSGEFSVNGQRTESNYYTVDGVSANSGASYANNGAGPSGSLPASTALGTTQSLVSVDALQEFRVESSTYSAEFGRTPGGQFSMVTRSGTNDWHGTGFDYFRNEALDANSWFNDSTIPITRKTPERQNDFGGTLGGPIRIPHLYNGKDHSFFFFSYEGLRLAQPQAASVNYVPDLSLRQSVGGPLQQVLNAFPLPTLSAPNLGDGFGEFIGAWSNPSQLDATSVRFDHNLGDRTHLFFRFSDTPSNSSTRGTSAAYSSPSVINALRFGAHTYTFGATTHLARNTDNDFRFNFTSSETDVRYYLDNFGGAVPLDLNQLQGIPGTSQSSIYLYFGNYISALTQTVNTGAQAQWNLVDTVNLTSGRHALKLGIDWRRLSPIIHPPPVTASYYYFSAADVSANSLDLGIGSSNASYYPLYTNFSAFAQDEWRATSRFHVSAGIRWDVNPAPGVTKGLMPYTISGLDDLSTMQLAPQGTQLWKTTWYNIAPRLGVAYVLNPKTERETVIRGGGGVFFDTGQQLGSSAFGGPGFSASQYFGNDYGKPASFPVAPTILAPSITNPPVPPYKNAYASAPHLQLPYTFEWSAALEQALGKSQSITLSYVGANGRKLIRESTFNVSQINPTFAYVNVIQNGLTSSYNALQVKYQRQVARGLQALVSYTWSHNIDFGSFNAAVPYQRGNSDYDVRHNATAAVSYDVPHSDASAWLTALTGGWGVDGRFTARSGFPVTLDGSGSYDPTTNAFYYGGLNLIPGVPLYQYGSRIIYPGGRRINPAAFSLPSPGLTGDAPRNVVRGFGAVQTDIALRRTFPIHDRVQGQFRAEAFNVFNHPNFGTVDPYYGDLQFGEATATLSQSLGVLSPLYQMGGPRSLQLSLKLSF